jgi:hypothetical protein
MVPEEQRLQFVVVAVPLAFAVSGEATEWLAAATPDAVLRLGALQGLVSIRQAALLLAAARAELRALTDTGARDVGSH